MSIAWFVALVLVAHRLLARFLGEVSAVWAASLFASLAVHADAVGLVANRSTSPA